MQRHWPLIWLTSATMKRRRTMLSRRPGRGQDTVLCWLRFLPLNVFGACEVPFNSDHPGADVRNALKLAGVDKKVAQLIRHSANTQDHKRSNLPHDLEDTIECLTDNCLVLPGTFTKQSQKRRKLAQGEDERAYVVDRPCAQNRPDPLHAAPERTAALKPFNGDCPCHPTSS